MNAGRGHRAATGRWSWACRIPAPGCPDDVARARSTSAARRSPTPTGMSTGSMTGSCPTRRWCAPPSTATSSTPTAAPDDASLYPGQNTTGLCPVTDFDGEPIYRPGAEPARDRNRAPPRRVPRALPCGARRARSQRVRARHGVAILYDCHSIRSRDSVPVRGHAARFQHRHRRRDELRSARSRTQSCDNLRGERPVTTGVSTAASRAAGRRVTTAVRPTAFTPSRWNWRSRRYLTTEAPPFDLRRGQSARRCVRCSREILQALAELAPTLRDRP